MASEQSDVGVAAVWEAKRYLLDSLSCALGGFQQEDVKLALSVLEEIAGEGPGTVIGTGERLAVVSASLANALMVRVQDYNDNYWQLDYPEGDPRNPLTDEEITEESTAPAGPIMTKGVRDRLIDAVWRLDELDSAPGLMELTRANG